MALFERTKACLRPRIHDDSGLTMVEVVVAVLMLGLLSVGVAGVLLNGIHLEGSNQRREAAAHLIAGDIDEVRDQVFQNPQLVVQGRTTSNLVVDGSTYTLTRDVEFVPQAATTSACLTSNAASLVLQVTDTATWQNMSPVRPVTSTTEITPQIAAYGTGTGNLGVLVNDRNGATEAGIPVTSSSATIITPADGCALFDHLAPATYSASLSKAGYVTPDLVAAPTQSQNVTVGTTAQLTFSYDQAGSIVPDLATLGKSDATHVPPTGMPYTVKNSQFSGTGVKSLPVAGLSGIFPDPAGDTVWLGDCTAPTGAPTVVVPPGGSVAAQLPASAFTITVTKSGLPVASGRVVTVTPDASLGCATGESYSYTTNSSGVITGLLPPGKWNFTPSSSAATAVTLAVGSNSSSVVAS